MEDKILFYLDEVADILAGKFVYPVILELDPTNRCQNNCYFCMFSQLRENVPVDLDLGLYERLLGELKGLKSIVFTGGGEPLLHPRFLDMVTMAKEKNIELGLVTNGILLDEVLPQLDDFTFVRISLNAATRDTYKLVHGGDYFSIVCESVRRLVAAKRKHTIVGLSFVVCERNEDEVVEAERMAKDLGVDYIQFKPDEYGDIHRDCGTGGGLSIVTKRYSIDSYLPCAIGGLVAVVLATGQLCYCCQHKEKSGFIVGDLNRSSFKELWKARRQMKLGISKCKTCRYMAYAKAYQKYNLRENLFVKHKCFL